MEQNIDLTKVTDSDQLKILKADQYDRLSYLNAEVERITANLSAISIRQSQLLEASSPTEQPGIAAGSAEMQPVDVTVTHIDNGSASA